MRVFSAVVFFIVIAAQTAAYACGPQVRIRFVEDSPDRFRIEFLQGPKLTIETVALRLGTSAAGAFFDGDYEGLALRTPQVHPNAAGVRLLSVRYGAGVGEDAFLAFEGFIAGRQFDFHSDLDDQGRAADPNENRIADGELAGATASASLIADNGKRLEISGTFDAKGLAMLGDRACV